MSQIKFETGKWGKFTEKGSYVINTPGTPMRWNNPLFNEEYVLDLSQRATGRGCRLKSFNQLPVFGEERSFWVRTEDKAYRLFSGQGSTYEMEFDLGCNRVTETFPEFQVTAEIFVPVQGKRELWRFTVKSVEGKALKGQLFCHFPVHNQGPMGGECRMAEDKNYVYKYSFPYHVFYEDMEKVKNDYAYIFVAADRKIDSFAGSGQAFFGSDNPFDLPAGVREGGCSNVDGEGSDLSATLCFDMNSETGQESVTLLLSTAPSQEEIEAAIEKFPSFDEEYGKVKALWQKRCEAYHMETPYPEMNHLFNRWFLKQAVFQSRLNRSSVYCPVRNQLQDAVGYSLVEPEEALEITLKVLRRQHSDGYLKQWYMVDGSPERDLCKIEHSDACIWLILCVTEIIQNLGDREAFLRPEPYGDSEKKETVLEHLRKAALYMNTQLGAHGLCLMKDGDWTDPINGAGRKGKGESVWNSMALVYAIRKLTRLFPDEELDTIADNLSENINRHCWDGEWYIAGFDDEGKPFGTKADKEAKIFLNTQTWAFIADIVPEDKKTTLAASIESLRVPFGYLLLSPAFSGWNETWGRISIKQKGTTENGSVYCHASMFKALGDCARGDKEAAFATIVSTLPVNSENPPEKSLQLPLYVPNYYFGLEGGNFGKSSGHFMTGTNSWLIWVMVKHILGVDTGVDEITFEGNLPDCLKGTKITKRYRGEIYSWEE